MLEAIQRLVRDEGQTLDLIVISGDLARRGKPEDYQVVEVFCQRLLTATGLPANRLFLAPGNHDVNRGAIEEGHVDWWYGFRDQDALGRVLSSTIAFPALMAKFEAFNEFAARALGRRLCDKDNYYAVETPEITQGGETFRVNLVGLNSALFAGYDGDDQRKLALGLPQVDGVLRGLDDGAALTIAFFHHPFDCFHPVDEPCQNRLMRKADLILTGHLHRPGSMFVRSATGQAVLIGAGAGYERRESEHNSFNLVEIDLATGEGRVQFYKYLPDHHLWKLNTDANPDDPAGVFAFDLERGRERPQRAGPGGPTPTPPQPSAKTCRSTLPRQPYFFGRAKELAIIADAIAPESRTWGALIDGPGGIGKTALAVRAGHLAPVADFDLKIFLSAKVRELTPAGEQPLEDFMLPNYMELLEELACEVGEPDLARLDPKERANAVRRALADKRALIVIDNVETFQEPERVRLYQFLSRLPGTCKAIVTSRRRTDIDARVVRLDRLAEADALELIAELAKNNRHLAKTSDQERRELYEITTGNPLLITWLAGQLGRPGSRCRTVAEAEAFMKSAPPDNDPLEFIFGDLLDTFTEHETAALAALAHFTQPAQVDWIAELSGLARPAAQTALEDLADRALVVADGPAQAFYLPPLAATFLRRRRPEAVAQTGDRLADRAYALAVENGYQKYDRFPALEAEWPAVAAALPLFLQGDNSRLQISVRCAPFLSRILRPMGRAAGPQPPGRRKGRCRR